MSAPDFATIIDLCINTDDVLQGTAATTILAAPIPALCPDCKGTGKVKGMNHGPADLLFTCPSCPTIARLLAIGAAVWDNSFAVDQPDESDLCDTTRHAYWSGSDACWQALKAVGG